MIRRSTRRPRTVTPDAFAKLQAKRCSEQIELLKHEIELHITRMAAMQAEIDHLRAHGQHR
jgi:uncharacterized small protein (DUF1192 family)